MKKAHYEAPTYKLYNVQFEWNVMFTNPADAYRQGTAGYYDDEDINNNDSY